MHGFEQWVTIAPAVWPGRPLTVQPGDLELFATTDYPIPLPRSALDHAADDDTPSNRHRSPFSLAPVCESGGGTVYFGDHCSHADFESMLRLMEVNGRLTDYAAFMSDAAGAEDRYLTQLKLISGAALDSFFHVESSLQGQKLRQQALPLKDALWKFVEWFTQENNAGRYSIQTLGENDGWSWENLAFGFMVENEVHGLYRIWTRSYFITK